MSMFKDDAERNKFLLEQSSIILAGLLAAPEDRYSSNVSNLVGSEFDRDESLMTLHGAIFRDLLEKFKDA
ncbi:hypothetical protein D8682_25130 [Buttiauxella sp. 3AFRM03]|uniref:hypothetical protein n=1 Tax=Buttiauxella sp. 3AFRM03 TaxID=2479367 RepID=UPI000EF7BAFF|nr:hypothetical protein [Buttiauxella sp. 3AFRM03]AYN29970.1 hypothetical protein D8682_25130 [Buttiauxella sp. 3AFRM03]